MRFIMSCSNYRDVSICMYQLQQKFVSQQYWLFYTYKIKCEMMTDKDTKCMIRVGHTRHDASVTKTTFGIHVSVI